MSELPPPPWQQVVVHKKLLELGWENLLDKPIEVLDYESGESVTYYPDIYIPSHNVDVEIDGRQHEEERQRLHDLKRTDLLEAAGIHVVRFSNPEVDDLLGVMDSIISFCKSRKLGRSTVEVRVRGLTFGGAKEFGVEYTLFRRDPRLTKYHRRIDTLSVGRGNNRCRRGVFDIVLPDAFAALTELEKIRFLERAARKEGINVDWWEDKRTHLSGVPDNYFDPPPDPPPQPRCIYVPPSEVKAREQASRRTRSEEQPKSGHTGTNCETR